MKNGKQAKTWQPEPGQWLIFRTDTQVQTQPIDIYVMLQIPSLHCYGYFLVPDTLPREKDIKKLLQDGFKKDGTWTRKLTLPKGDPAEQLIRKVAELHGVVVEVQPSNAIEPFARPFKEEFGKFAFSPSGMIGSNLRDDVPEDDRKAAEASIPDSYDPCPCNSGKKYKFCCKKVFREIVMAMCAAEEGKKEEALEWMAKAQAIVGETAEVLCRYGIVQSHFDRKRADEYLEECLRLFPHYPRAYYIQGIGRREKGDFAGALDSYKRAIENLVPTDKYHLNEVWNNVGTIYHDLGKYAEAKSAWEKALVYLPSDCVVKDNLIEFIYTNPAVPETLRRPSPFVEYFMTQRNE